MKTGIIRFARSEPSKIIRNASDVQVKSKSMKTGIIKFARSEPSKIIRNASDVQVKNSMKSSLHTSISCYFINLLSQSHAQKGIYFIYRGAVVGSRGLIRPSSRVSLIIREATEFCFEVNPKRSRKVWFDICSCSTYLRHACM